MSEREPPHLWHVLGSMPMTNIRIQASVMAMLATAFRVIGWDWTPPIEWLAFLTAWGGIDGWQFAKNRTTDYGYVARTQPTPMTSTSTMTTPDGTVSETVTKPAEPTPPETGA